MATRLWTPNEYAELMGITPQWVRQLCRDGCIKAFAFKSGKVTTWRIPFDAEEIDEMAAQNGKLADR